MGVLGGCQGIVMQVLRCSEELIHSYTVDRVFWVVVRVLLCSF